MAQANDEARDFTDLEQFKDNFKNVQTAIKRFLKPSYSELDQLTEVLRDATANNRMGTDKEFAKFINEEMAIGIMSKLANTQSTDELVSIGALALAAICLFQLFKRDLTFICSIVFEFRCRLDERLCRALRARAEEQALQRDAHLRHDLVLQGRYHPPLEPLPDE